MDVRTLFASMKCIIARREPECDKLKNRFLPLLMFCLFFSSLSALGQTPSVGEAVPAFSLKTVDGKSVSLRTVEQHGPTALVVLRGYPGYQCPFCVKQVHDFIENADKFAALGTEVVLIYPGPPGDLDVHAREFLAKQNPMPAGMYLLLDPDFTVTNQYGLRWDAPHETAYPSTFLLDRKGVVFFRKISKGHGDRTSAADILAELQKQSAHASIR